jgi:N-acetylmuramoyl-L-alanine amidase
VKGVVVHYTANPGTDAEDNRNYFNNLPKINAGKQKATYASSHFVIGLEGQIVQCIPLNEIAYASNGRNYDTISIECCHPGKDGKFNNATYQALIELVSYLCLKYDLTKEQVIRHYDVTGKLCPLYFVKHEDEWNQLKDKIEKNCQTISKS